MLQHTELFNELELHNYTENVFEKIGREWMLLTAGTSKSFNTMTASWGTLGVLWHKPVAIGFIRPTRHTFKFAEENDMFTMSFMKPEDKDILTYCGSHSGSQVNKCEEIGML
ncbi:MAG: flavin reductase, partial [Bacteroidales bacterium]|nr:flavin reductase [Bacteroidales bacterium]